MDKPTAISRAESGGVSTGMRHLERLLILALVWVVLVEVGDQLAYAQMTVDPRSGELHVASTDLVVPAGPVVLAVRRWLQPVSSAPGVLGTRWQLNWESRLLKHGDVVVVQEEGADIPFAPATSQGEYRGPLGERLVYGSDGRAVRSKGDGSREIFDANGRLVERDARNGNTIRLRYGASGHLVTVEGPYGSFLRFVVDGNGLASRVESSTGAVLRYTYGQGRLAQVQTADDHLTRYAYDQAGLLVRMADTQVGTTEIAYDEQGRVVKRRWEDGSQEVFAYEDAANRVRHTDPGGGVTAWSWSADRRREEIIDPLGGTSILEYDADGRLLKVTGPTQLSASFGYDALGRLINTQDAAGQTTRNEYLGETALVAAITYPNGTRQTFDYDGQRNLVAIKNAQDIAATFTYLPNGLIESVTQLGGSAWRFAYAPEGHLATLTDALDHTTRFEYDKRSNLIRETNPLGGVTTRTYDIQGRLSSLVDPAGATWRYDYAPSGLLARLVDPAGGVTQYTHDALGRLVAETDPAGRSTRYAYHADGRLKSVTDAADQSFRFEHDQGGNLRRVINPLGGVTAADYDALGRLRSITDAAGHTTRYESSPAGSLTKLIDAMGRATHFEYDAQGRLVKVADETNRATRYEYTLNGLLAKIVPPTGPAIAYEYDKAGNRISAAAGKDVVVRYQYDSLGQRILEQHATGLEIAYRYDAMGNLLGWKDSLGAGVTIQYDAQGRATSVTAPSGAMTRYGYDLMGNVVSVTNALGHAQRRAYTAAGELAELSEPTGASAKYEYDATGRLAKVHHPGGGESQFAYDPLGNPIKVPHPLGKERHQTYDAAGRLLSMTDAKGQSTTFSYDAAGRLSQKRLADGKVVHYRYDAMGNLVQVDDGAFPMRYSYDVNQRLVQIEYPALKRTLSYAYDEAGLLSKFIDSEGRTVLYEYDSAKRLSAIKLSADQSIAFTYDAKDRLTSLTYPNGVKGSWTYDAADRPTRITYSDRAGKSIAGWQYAYDAASNRVETIDAQGRATRYRYDPVNQLVEEDTGAGATARYSYLPGGNREIWESGGKTIRYRYDQAERVLEAGNETFTYDANGNLTERRGPRGVTRYVYDTEDRLVKVALPDGSEVSFGYAPTGERVWRKDSTGLAYFVTDGLQPLAQLGEDLRAKAVYLYGPGIDRPLMQTREGQSYFYHADMLGSIASLTDGRGQVVASYTYDPFGTVKGQQGTVPNPFAFTGREYDPALGLYFYRARYYDPSLGRFLTPDPLPGAIFDVFSFNPYLYVWNNPLRFTDVLGLAGGVPPDRGAINRTLGQHGFGPIQGYNPAMSEPGHTLWNRNTGTSTVHVGPKALTSEAQLLQTVRHEFQHVMINQRPVPGDAAQIQEQGGLVGRLERGEGLRALRSDLQGNTNTAQAVDRSTRAVRAIEEAEAFATEGRFGPVPFTNDPDAVVTPPFMSWWNRMQAWWYGGSKAYNAAVEGATVGGSSASWGPVGQMGTLWQAQKSGAIEFAPKGKFINLKIDPNTPPSQPSVPSNRVSPPGTMSGTGIAGLAGGVMGGGLSLVQCLLDGGSAAECRNQAEVGAAGGVAGGVGFQAVVNMITKYLGASAAQSFINRAGIIGAVLTGKQLGTAVGIWAQGGKPELAKTKQAEAEAAAMLQQRGHEDINALITLRNTLKSDLERLKQQTQALSNFLDLSSACGDAATFIEKMKDMAHAASEKGKNAAALMETTDEQTNPTPRVQQAHTNIKEIVRLVPDIRRAVDDFKQVQSKLQEGLNGLKTNAGNEKKLNSDVMRKELNALADQIENNANRIVKKKEDIRHFLKTMQSMLPSTFDSMRRSLAGVAQSTEPDQLSILEAKLDALELPPELPADLKAARDLLTRKEGQDCQKFPGEDPAKAARDQASEALKDFKEAFRTVSSAYEKRHAKVRKWLQASEKTINETGPKKIDEAKRVSDKDTLEKAEKLVNIARKRLGDDRKESEQLTEIQKTIGEAAKAIAGLDLAN